MLPIPLQDVLAYPSSAQRETKKPHQRKNPSPATTYTELHLVLNGLNHNYNYNRTPPYWKTVSVHTVPNTPVVP
jgi:hypothetical protein